MGRVGEKGCRSCGSIEAIKLAVRAWRELLKTDDMKATMKQPAWRERWHHI